MWLTIALLFLCTGRLEGISTRFTNINCIVLDAKSVDFERCNLKVLGRGIIGVNVTIKYLRSVARNKINLSLWRRYNGYRPFMFNITFDFCNLMSKKHSKLSFEKIVFDALLKESNLNHSCPFEQTVTIRDLIFKDEFMKFLPVPSGDYKLQIKVSDESVLMYQIDVKIQHNERE